MRRRWRRIGHVLRREPDITRVALHWTPEGKRKRGRPKNSWRRTVEGGLKTLKHNWDTIRKLALSKQQWRTFVAALHASRHKARHILHPEYLQPLPSTPVSPIELDAKKSPLALLAQTCSQIGKPDPPPASKLSSVTSNGSNDKDSKTVPLKLSDIGVEDKSSFKPYSKSSEKKDSSSGASSGEKSGFRVPSATCQPFTPRTGSPNSSTSASPLPSEGKLGEREDKKESESNKNSITDVSGATGISHNRISVSCTGINGDVNQLETTTGSKLATSDSTSVSSTSSASVLGSGLVAPVSPYKPGQTVFPLPPAGMTYPSTLAGAYAGYPQHFLPPGEALSMLNLLVHWAAVKQDQALWLEPLRLR
ncbi:hypothetical protein GJAV_G00243550 [Gymnothorax javanicus]|nr:hypothetical protein GJAV_G00243550 [Gymnothorax javanicus]